jgi:hypothetical protein
MIMEAVYLKVLDEDAKAQKEAEESAKKKQWKEDKTNLEQFR